MRINHLSVLVLILLIGLMTLAPRIWADTITVEPVPIVEGDFALDPIAVTMVGSVVTLSITPGSFGDGSQVLTYQWQDSPDSTTWRNISGGSMTGGVKLDKSGSVITTFSSMTTIQSAGVAYVRIIGTLVGTDISLALGVTY